MGTTVKKRRQKIIDKIFMNLFKNLDFSFFWFKISFFKIHNIITDVELKKKVENKYIKKIT